MSETPTGWRDRQGLSRSERQKESRRLALRARFAAITRLYERALARRKLDAFLQPERPESDAPRPDESNPALATNKPEPLFIPALLGVGAGLGAYFAIVAML